MVEEMKKTNDENVMVIDSKFNFKKDLSLIRSRINSIVTDFEKDIEYFGTQINTYTILKILIEVKDKLPYKYLETIKKLAPNFKNKSISDLEYYESKMIIISLTIMFESFYKDIILLGAFYNTKSIINYFDGKGTLKNVIDAIETNDTKKFENLIINKLSMKENGKEIIKIFKFIYNKKFFPSENTQTILCDLIKIRNIIVHQNSKPKEKDYENISQANVIIKHDLNKDMAMFSKVNFPTNIIIFRLNLSNKEFLMNIINGLNSFVIHIKENIFSNFNS